MFLKHRALQGNHRGSRTKLAIPSQCACILFCKEVGEFERNRKELPGCQRCQTGDATDVSERTVHAIVKEGMTKGGFASPERNYEGRRLPAAESAPTSR